MADDETRRVAVIAGAGPAGLTAAYELVTRTDIVPIVYEATDQVGGLARTGYYKGNRLDLGGHRFFSKSERVMDWWFDKLPLQTEDGPGPEEVDALFLRRPRLSRIFFRRQFFPYPLKLSLGVARKLGFINAALIFASYLKAQLLPVADESHLEGFFINRFGRRLYETFFRAYTEKVWGLPCREIRADWGAQRIKGLSLKGLVAQALRDLVGGGDERDRETTLITRFYYPKLGPGQLWEIVTELVRERGGEVHLSRPVTGVEMADGRIIAAQVGEERVPCDLFFSTMPIKALVAATDPPAPAEVREVADDLRYRDFLTVGLLLRKLHVQQGRRAALETLPDNWIYIQEGDVKVGRVQIYNNWSPHLVADPDTVWLGLEYFVNDDQSPWTDPDDEVIAMGTAELERIGFCRAQDVLDACVLRSAKAYPAYFGSFERLDVVRAWVSAIPNLYLIGRNGQHRYNNQDHSMLTAMLAVDNILAGRTDDANVWDVNVERVYAETVETPAKIV